jgi:hypothetical protein
MYLDHSTRPAHDLLGHVRRHSFLYLSVVLHAALLAVLYYFGSYRIELDRQQQSIEYGTRLTEQARLEKRVHDMEQIRSLLEESAAADGASKKKSVVHDQDDVQFSAQPKAPDELLKEARDLSRKIDEIERDTKAEELAKVLDIPKEKALEQVKETRKPEEPPVTEPRDAAEAAKQIEKLEARARDALEERRQQLERQQNGTAVTAGESNTGGNGQSAHGAGLQGQNMGSTQGSGAQGGQGGVGQGDTGSGVSMLGRIAEFKNRDVPDRATKEYTSGGLNEFFDRGVGHIPDVDASTMVKGSGRVIGPGGSYANRIYVNRWYLIGPFEGKHGEGLFSNYRHPPERGVVLDAAYRGKGGRLLKWEYIDMARYPLIPPDEAEDAVYYGYTELMVDKEQDLTMWVGADDDTQVWLNDRLVWKGGNVNKAWFFGQVYDTWNTLARDYNLNEDKRRVHLRKGRNKLFFKLANGPTRLFFSLVLTK